MIRKASMEDFEPVRNLLLKEKITTGDFFTRERYAAALAKWGKYYLVDERNSRIVGFVSGFDDGGIFYGYMGRLAVDDNYRRHCIGAELTNACLLAFRESGIPVVFAGVGFGNDASHKLLEKSGFVMQDYRLVYFDNDLSSRQK